MNALILTTHTHSGILSLLAAAEKDRASEPGRGRLIESGEGERKRNSSALKEEGREGCMKSTEREGAKKRGSDPAEECHSAEERGDSRLDGPSSALMEHGSGFRVLPLQ